MGINNAINKTIKINQRIPQKELKQIQELKVENKELKKQVKALHKFIKRFKSFSPRSVTSSQAKEAKKERCPKCKCETKTLKLERLDGCFTLVSCNECDWRTSFTIDE